MQLAEHFDQFNLDDSVIQADQRSDRVSREGFRLWRNARGGAR